MPRPLSHKALRFGLIGVANTALDAAVFGLLLQAGAQVLLANLGGWMAGVCLSFWANSRWTFQAQGAPAPIRFLRFALSGAAVSLLTSTAILASLTGLLGVWPAKAIAIAVGAVLGFLAARWSIEGRRG
jgi:putative flippase GtrA